MKDKRGRQFHQPGSKTDGLSADTVRANIRRVRKEKRLSAQQVSERVGISRPFYTQLEGGKRRLSIDYLLAIAEGLGVNGKDQIKI